jgi:hypothetical protein
VALDNWDDILAIYANKDTRFWNVWRACNNENVMEVDDVLGIDIVSAEPGSSGVVVPVYLENDSTELQSVVYRLERFLTVYEEQFESRYGPLRSVVKRAPAILSSSRARVARNGKAGSGRAFPPRSRWPY